VAGTTLSRVSRLSDPSCCDCCCCLFPDCGSLSNAWHLRNFNVVICFVAAPLSMMLLLFSIVLLTQREACTSRCVMPTWDCKACARIWELTLGASGVPCCAWGAWERWERRENASEAGFGREADFYCRQTTPAFDCPGDLWAERYYSDCERTCACTGGRLEEVRCYSSKAAGAGGLVSGLAALGFAALSLLSVARYNAFHLGRGVVVAQPPPGSMVRTAPLGGLVVGQPVRAEPTTAVACGIVVPRRRDDA